MGRDVLAIMQAVRQAAVPGCKEELQQDQAQGSSTGMEFDLAQAAEASQAASSDGLQFVGQVQVPAGWIQQALHAGQAAQQGQVQCQVQ